ncbi:MAG: 50S ribosomal protein L35 [candidate division KSB1 bacterium]|nr:50S ribosomal protein L35 [candidate division KSB1 bacterium]MDZ7335993.1 50S ribosomal protein L35 [candidate division KSB1 bacterium]MDZ7358282.1 50S ribosomal protein L35 [candidate division KSB1 bacterium]MDZ7376041.1 50S ribosomal protein L35 [candidate division KSB1 bacterium]MDZ7401399.1 50S ribosomal protein L35 [candidate division KSB1 bacterium]
MPKMKSKRSAKKRYQLTGSGKVKRFQAFKSHILTSKTRKRKRNLRKPLLVSKADLKRVKSLILA